MQFDHKDGGFKSRKMVMSYIIIGLIFAGFILTGLKPALAVTFSEYCMALLAAAGIYAGGNTAIKWMSSKVSKKGKQEESDEEDEDDLPPAPKPKK